MAFYIFPLTCCSGQTYSDLECLSDIDRNIEFGFEYIPRVYFGYIKNMTFFDICLSLMLCKIEFHYTMACITGRFNKSTWRMCFNKKNTNVELSIHGNIFDLTDLQEYIERRFLRHKRT